MESDFSELEKGESEWPPSALPDPKRLYTDFYEDIHKLARNIVCGSCGCIGHDRKQYHRVPIASDLLDPLKVDPALVPFDFSSRYDVLKERQIMVNDMAISDDLQISLCSSCHLSLADDKKTPRDSMANYRWIGDIPEELQREPDISCSFDWEDCPTSESECQLLFFDQRTYSIGAPRYSQIGGLVAAFSRFAIGFCSSGVGRQDGTKQATSP